MGLVLSMKPGDKIYIGDDGSSYITLCDIGERKVKIDFNFPKHVDINREVLFFRKKSSGFFDKTHDDVFDKYFCPDGDDDLNYIINSRIEDMNISDSVFRLLKRNGIEFVGDIVSNNKNYIKRLDGMGPISYGIIKNELEKYNVYFGMNIVKNNIDNC